MPTKSSRWPGGAAAGLGFMAAVLGAGACTAADRAPAPTPVFKEGPIAEGQYRRLHDAAERLYVATSRDAETFEAAILIPEVRAKIARVLGPGLTDDRLRALARKSRDEAVYWYGYMQGLERAR